jgi:hypothetical protein
MNCDRIRTMLYLYRAGELANREAEELLHHLHSCESCRLEKERIDKVEATVRRVRSFEPAVVNPDLLTSKIMTRVRTSATETPHPGMIDRILDLFVLPQVRLGSATFVALVVGTFLFQYLTLFTNIHSLELSAGQRSMASSAAEALYSVESTRVQELAKLKDLQKLLPTGQYKIAGGQILVHQSDVTSFLSSYGFRSLTSTVASSVLRMDKRKLDNIIEDVAKSAKTITGFGR